MQRPERSPRLESLPMRVGFPRHGAEPNARRLWAALKDTYAQGISLCDLVQRIDALQFPLKLEHVDGSHHRVLRHAVESLQLCRPVILSLAPLDRPTRLHAVLGIGLSGQMDGRRFVSSALLITDSFEEHPGVGPVNARLQFSPAAKRETRGLYTTAYDLYRVALDGAISVRLTSTPRTTTPRMVGRPA